MKLTVKSEELDAEMEDDEGIDHRSTITNTPSPNGSEVSEIYIIDWLISTKREANFSTVDRCSKMREQQVIY